MATEDRPGRLAVPALRAHMGDWVYYVTFLKMRDVAARVSLAQQIHQGESLKDLIQREITNRSGTIRDYLLRAPQRFFNALVIAVYGGAPQWLELEVQENALFDPGQVLLPDFLGTLGILYLDGTEELFALDGQHRVVGIKQAVKRDKALGDEEVSALFVAHANTPSGMERTRRLFTTLNRYAKPVSKMEIIALDEDDIVAIVTRAMLEGDRILQERTSLSRGKNIAPSDRHSFTTVVALYDALNIYLGARRKNWNRIKRIRPEDSEIAGYLRSANALWNGLLSHFSPLQQLRNAPADDAVVTRYRNSTGGHLMFRPIGLVIVVAVITLLTHSGTTLEEATSLVAKAPMDLGEEPWVGLLWDATNERMITTNVNQRVATAILFYLVGGDLSVISSSSPTLQEELAGILNKPTEEVDLSRLRQT